jgi:hypothetical protein
MIKFEISETTFSRKASSTYELSILQRMDSFVFMVTNERHQVLILREHPLPEQPEAVRRELEDLRSGEEILRLPYRQVRIGLVTDRHTLIPNRLYNPQEKKTYLAQITPLGESFEVKSDDVQGLAAQNVYAFRTHLLDFYRQAFPAGRILHAASAFLQAHRVDLPNHRGGALLCVHVWSHYLQIVLYQGRDLQFINVFGYRSTKDFLYFTMLVFDQFDLDPVDVPLRLTGQILEDSEIYRALTRYIRQVEFGGTPPGIAIGEGFDQVPAYMFYDLFSLLSAGS